jgi:hypothetical protein
MAEYYVFAGDYKTGMDRYYEPASMGSFEMPINKIGISTPPMKDQLESLKARIFQGASKVELGFMGMQKGSMGQGAVTPEMYGAEEREAIRDLAKINRVELTTHAAPGAVGAAGFDQRQGKFSEEHQKLVVDEIKRTIEFAADTAGGGPVVVHTGEWHRPLFDIEKSEKYKEKFEAYPKEKEKEAVYLVDEKTGQLTGIPRDIEVFQPITDEKTGEYKYEKDGTVMMEKLNYDQLLEKSKKVYPDLTPDKALFRFYQDTNIRRAKAEMTRFLDEKERYQHVYEKLRQQQDYWSELEKSTPREKQDIVRKSFEEALQIPLKEGMSIKEAIGGRMKEIKRNLEWVDEISIQAKQTYENINETMKRIKPIEDVGIKKTASAISDMALYAYDVERMKKLEKPLYISPENIFPEGYGSHPQELKRIILESRKDMVDKLKARGIKEEQAEKIAEEHVKATFDIGHAYTWRKFFKGSDPTNIEKTNKEFKEWVMDNVKDLLKSKVIGRAHISDNFGYYDEHVTPGQGIVPIKEFVEELKKAKVTDVIVEPAHQDIKALLGAWEHFGSSIYTALMPWGGRDRWSDIQHSYFGRTAGPNYIVGDIRPSEEWTLWSQTPLE